MNATPRNPAAVTIGWPVQAVGSLLTPERRRAIRHGLIVGGLVAAVIVGWSSYQGGAIDAYSYWVNRPPVSYDTAPGTDNAYLYSPAFAQLISPLTALPWEIFLAIWLVAMLATLAWLVGPVLLFPAILLTGNEINYGNIHFFMAAAMVIGFRHPWTWALVLLTKVTPGVGLLWFAVRREWRALAVALGATAAIAAVSVAVDPNGWAGWIALLAGGIGGGGHPTAVPGPLWLRLPIAALIVVWGARKDRPWTVPVAAVVALPHGAIGTAMLVAVVPLLRRPDIARRVVPKPIPTAHPSAQPPAGARVQVD